MSDIGFLAQFAYDTGTTALDYAEVNVIRANVDAFMTPGAFPGDVNPATAALSRRILGDLMDAGWTPPEMTR